MMTVINTKAHNEALVTAQSQTNSIMEVRHFFSEGRSHETSMEQTRTNHPERKATHNSRLADGAPLCTACAESGAPTTLRAPEQS